MIAPSPRYLHDSTGRYVAYVENASLFSAEHRWLGVVVGDEVFNVAGHFIGRIDSHHRLVQDLRSGLPRQILRPPEPLGSRRPLPAKRALFAPGLERGLHDVFLNLRRSPTRLVPAARLAEVGALAGAEIRSSGGDFLGLITPEDHPDSIGNRHGPFGGTRGEWSIFNPAGRFGSSDSEFSPWNSTASNPPRLLSGSGELGPLTTNPSAQGAWDPNELIAWLAAL